MPRTKRAIRIDPLYKVAFWFWHGAEEPMLRQARRDGWPELEAHGGAGRTLFYRKDGRYVCHLWLNGQYRLSRAFTLAAVSHEAVHATFNVWNAIGQATPKGKSGSDECFAYYVEWIVREYLQAMRVK